MNKMNDEEWKRFQFRVKKINEDRDIVGVAFFSAIINVILIDKKEENIIIS